MKKELRIAAITLAMAAILFFSCRYDKVNPNCAIPQTVSFHKDILPIFKVNCNESGCHSGGSPAGHLSLEDSLAYKQLMVPGTGYIDTTQPAYSILYVQLSSSFDLMPPSGELDSCTRHLVLAWIQQGAKNN